MLWLALVLGCANPVSRVNGEAILAEVRPLLAPHKVTIESCMGVGMTRDAVCRGSAKGPDALSAAVANGWQLGSPSDPEIQMWARPDACAGDRPFNGTAPHALWRSARRAHRGLEFLLMYHDPATNKVCVHTSAAYG